MKLGKKILIIALIILLLLLIVIHILVNIFGKTLLAQKLEDAFHRKIQIGSLSTSFPLNVHVKDIEAKGLFKVDEIFAAGGVFDIFRKSFRLSLLKVIHPQVTIEKSLVNSTAEVLTPANVNLQEKNTTQVTAVNSQVEGALQVKTSNLDPMTIPKGKFLFPQFSIGCLIVSDGVLNFTDRINNKEIIIKVERLNIKVDNLNLSRIGSRVTSFGLKGVIPWREGEENGKIELEGWLNLAKRNMEASLKIQDIDGIYLYPYYSTWVNLEKARIESAKLNFISNINGLNNNVTAECHLELTDIVRKPRSPEEPEEKAEKIASAVLDIFKALNQGRIVLDFTIRTKMDRPEFGFGNIKMAFEDKLAKAQAGSSFKAEDVLMLPGKLLEGMVKGATDFSKAVIDGTFAVGNEVKKAVEDTFKKEPKENKEENKENKE